MDVITLIGHLSFIAIAVSFLIRDILWLRALSIVASALAIVFNYFVPGGPIWLVIGWSVVFIAINTYNILFLIREKRGVSFTPVEQEMYETVFQGFSPVEFMRLLRIGTWKEAEADQTLITEGQNVSEIMFLCNGQADVVSGGRRIGIVKDGALVGEMELAEDKPAVATVRTTTPTRYMAWSLVELRRLLIRSPSINSTIHSIFSAELMRKLQQSASGEGRA